MAPTKSSTLLVLVLALALSATSCRGLGPDRQDLEALAYPVLVPPRTIDMDGNLVEPDALPEQGFIDFAHLPPDDLVQLHVRDSYYTRTFAVHPYFLVYDARAERWEQWEVWSGDLYGWSEGVWATGQRRRAGEKAEHVVVREVQYGTVRRIVDLNYRSDHEREHIRGEWRGETARRIIDVLQRPLDYPYVDDYRIWPGPNSNTYPTWVLERAQVSLDLDPRMVGKDWRGLFGTGIGLASARTGVRADVLGLGLAIGLREGVEVHLFGATLGLDLWPPALKTPFGRLGFAE
ncbi:hypothetical protein Pla163_12850 [Planctomycetes bacterium Pla163]|uniref:DUF3750 domain-containing protein n=1 Tax=Rohdeia mirabilis TaxID=2528008 RepID=A0A518CY78_9BACT|nr:hypothetical protein Pla163_12850 [Planctomycetes bacterium Pla163]